MSHAKVRNIFQTAVRNYATTKGLRVAYDNVQFTPKVDEIYLAVHLLPSSTKALTLDADIEGFNGIFQITIVGVAGKATNPTDVIAQELKEEFTAFKRYTDSSGFTVMVMSPLHTPEGKVRNGSWVVPCYFDYRADID